jgi:hypothetical protein
VLFDNFPTRLVIVAGVQAEVLWLGLGRLWALDHDRLDRLGQQQVVVDVGRGDDDCQRSTTALDQQAFFEPFLPRSVGLGPIWSPPLRALPSAPSAACQRQSTRPSTSHSARSSDQIISKSPSAIHRWKVRWIVESSPNSFGMWFHWHPVRK